MKAILKMKKSINIYFITGSDGLYGKCEDPDGLYNGLYGNKDGLYNGLYEYVDGSNIYAE